MLKRLLCGLTAACLTTASHAHADTILYSTLREGDGFRTSRFWQAHDFDPAQGGDLQISLAMPFTISAPAGAVVRSIELALEFDPTGEDFVQADLYSAVNGAPGAFITIAGFHDLPFFATPDRLLPVTTNLELAPGQYFLSIFSTGDIRTVWWQTTAPVFGGWKSVNGGPWTGSPDVPSGAFRLIGEAVPASPVPEPGSLLLIAGGLAVSRWCIRRRSRPTRGSRCAPGCPRAAPGPMSRT
jgi:PEP-CTERM motif-containing protein